MTHLQGLSVVGRLGSSFILPFYRLSSLDYVLKAAKEEEKVKKLYKERVKQENMRKLQT